jgi:hypothetical protein
VSKKFKEQTQVSFSFLLNGYATGEDRRAVHCCNGFTLKKPASLVQQVTFGVKKIQGAHTVYFSILLNANVRRLYFVAFDINIQHIFTSQIHNRKQIISQEGGGQTIHSFTKTDFYWFIVKV